LTALNFPLYPLPSSNWYKADGTLFIDTQVLDDTKMPGETLGLRRLQCGRKDLFKLRRAVVDIPGLLKARGHYFIDIKGNPLIYEKTMTSKLKAYSISRVDRKEEASLLWLNGVNFPITITRPPLNNPRWARLLHRADTPWLLYDYVSTRTKDTYRKV
jgi:hypothetical protein